MVTACLLPAICAASGPKMVQQPATFACCATFMNVPCCSRPTPPRPAHRAVRPAQAAMRALQPGQASALSAFAAELTDLRKYAVLNYVACIKAVKKRNRHLRAAVGASAAGPPLRAVDLLSQQYFFTSPKLAALATRAEVLLQARAPRAALLQALRGACRQAWSASAEWASTRRPCMFLTRHVNAVAVPGLSWSCLPTQHASSLGVGPACARSSRAVCS